MWFDDDETARIVEYLSDDSVVDFEGIGMFGVEFSSRDLGAYRRQSASTEYRIFACYKYVFRWQDGSRKTLKRACDESIVTNEGTFASRRSPHSSNVSIEITRE